jgi:hypothetical protein
MDEKLMWGTGLEWPWQVRGTTFVASLDIVQEMLPTIGSYGCFARGGARRKDWLTSCATMSDKSWRGRWKGGPRKVYVNAGVYAKRKSQGMGMRVVTSLKCLED